MNAIIRLLKKEFIYEMEYTIVENDGRFRVTFNDNRTHQEIANITRGLYEIGFSHVYADKKNLLILK